jgi:hypothetical protein
MIYIIIVVTAFMLPASYFIVGWFVQLCASRTKMVENEAGVEEKRPAPIYWAFVPEKTTAYLQRKGNRAKERGVGSKATPASGSPIFDIIHSVSGKYLDRRSENLNDWCFVDEGCIGSETYRKGEKYDEELFEAIKQADEKHRRGIFYHLYGVHTIGFFTELRTVKVREVRISVDDEEMHKHKLALKAWEEGGKVGAKPKEPSYSPHVKDYETEFPFFSREHGVAIKEAETAGAFTLDMYSNVVYEETYPYRVRMEVSDPNATLSTLVERVVNNETAGHEPEYYLFEDVPRASDSSPVPDDEFPKLAERRRALTSTVKDNVNEATQRTIGITIKEFILYSIDMDEETRTLLELKERVEREKEAEIAAAKKDVEKAKEIMAKKIVDAEADREAMKIRNDGEADRIERVVKPLAENENTVRIREAEAYEKNVTVTTFAPGGRVGLMVDKK